MQLPIIPIAKYSRVLCYYLCILCSKADDSFHALVVSCAVTSEYNFTFQLVLLVLVIHAMYGFLLYYVIGLIRHYLK